MAGAMRFNLTCPRCGGKGRLPKYLPDVLWGWPRLAARFSGGTDSRRVSKAVRACASQVKAMRARKAHPQATCISRFASTLTQFFERDGDNIGIKVPITVTEAGIGSED